MPVSFCLHFGSGVLLLAGDERPHFDHLHPFAAHVSHEPVVMVFAVGTDNLERGRHHVFAGVGQPRRGTDGVALGGGLDRGVGIVGEYVYSCVPCLRHQTHKIGRNNDVRPIRLRSLPARGRFDVAED